MFIPEFIMIESLLILLAILLNCPPVNVTAARTSLSAGLCTIFTRGYLWICPTLFGWGKVREDIEFRNRLHSIVYFDIEGATAIANYQTYQRLMIRLLDETGN